MNTKKKVPFEKTPIGNIVSDIVGWVLFFLICMSGLEVDTTKKVFNFVFPFFCIFYGIKILIIIADKKSDKDSIS